MLKEDETIRGMAEEINSVFRSRKGDLVIKLKNGTSSLNKIAEAMGESIGNPSKIRQMTSYDKLVVQDLDELAEECEVTEVERKVVKAQPESLRITSNFSVARGIRWMVVSMTSGRIGEVIRAGWIRVGFVSCRVRKWEERGVGRCPRCLGIGHTVSNCNGPDRSNMCRGFGQTGHQVASCTANTEDRNKFKESLRVGGTETSTQNGKLVETTTDDEDKPSKLE